MLIKHRQILIAWLGLIIFALCANSADTGTHPSYSPKKIKQISSVPYYPNASYEPGIPEPKEVFGQAIGEWPVRYHKLVEYIKILSEKSDRVYLETHGQTHEGRDLFNLFVSTEENIRLLEENRAKMARLADPTQELSVSELKTLVNELPAFAWLGYSIHGDEISGVDAAMQLLYHLAAAQDSATLHLLKNVIVIIDPIENPDGRERYLSMLQSYKSAVPSYDRHSLQHGGIWPAGRGNHYLFDLNRDWILVNQPETRGKLHTILKYNPVITVDAHEMGSDETYLFTPPREPINANTADNVKKWWPVFSEDQARAFDQRRWPYYIGEWHEQWYPGYGSAWSTFFGSVGILYEQANVDGSMVKQPDDYLLTYHEAVNHQFTSSLANLFTVANHRQDLLSDYRSARIGILEKGRKSGLTFLVAPDIDKLKMNRFLQSLLDQGIEVQRTTQPFTAGATKDFYGQEHRSKSFPAGTYLISTAQVNGALARTIFEFDPHFALEFLKEERKEIEKREDTRIYEVTAWSTPIAYDLDAYSTTSAINAATEKVTEVTDDAGQLFEPGAQYAFIVNMEGEKTYRALNRLFQAEITVFGSEKPFRLENNNYNAGALVIRKLGNPDDLVEILRGIAAEIGINIRGVNTGSAQTGSYLGAPTMKVLRQPRIALLAGSPISSSTFATIWFALDKQIEVSHSLVYFDALSFVDLSKYNVLIIPSAGGGIENRLGKSGTETIKGWVKDGGTLICMDESAVWAADTATGLSQVRLLHQTLDKLDKYATDVRRERASDEPVIDTMAIWYPDTITKKPEEEKKEAATPSKEKMEENDKWVRRYFPRGTILQAEIDTEDWLAFGLKKKVPVMMYPDNAFLAGPPVHTTARFASGNSLRVAGLLWPEARQRWAETAYATRESLGKGQIILFAHEPNMRAYFYGTRRMLINAILYGPGLGTSFETPYRETD